MGFRIFKIICGTGPIFKDNIDTIGVNGVTVPGFYYKVLYDGNKMIGFIISNASSKKALEEFDVKIDEIELKTGIDFFSGLDDEVENQLENSINLEVWDFN